MKWTALLKEIKDKVGLSHHRPRQLSLPSSTSSSPSSSSQPEDDLVESPVREKNELELEFKRFWEEFQLSRSGKEKEAALSMTVDIFCRLVKQTANITQLVTRLVEAHIFSFVVGRAFVTDIEKLKINSKTRSLDVGRVLCFFSDISEGGFSPGSNLLFTVEVLVSGAVDKQPLLDSGILCCVVHILNALMGPDGINHQDMEANSEEPVLGGKSHVEDVGHKRRLEVEGSTVHIIKALATHPSAAQSLIEDDSLELLFHMVATKSLTVFSQFREGLVPLHTIQLHRHAMQILSLLLLNDSGSTAKYIRKHHLVKVLLMAVRDFDPDCGDPAYTMGIIDLLLECVELSYRRGAGGIRLREDIHNAHGYQFLVQFALLLSRLQKDQDIQSASPKFFDRDSASEASDTSFSVGRREFKDWGNSSLSHLSPSLSRLLDALVNLSQAGRSDHTVGDKGSKSTSVKVSGFYDETWEDSTKVKDLEAIRTLQDIFLKADNIELQAEVLNRMFKIFSSHLENYKQCQELRTIPRLILNMEDYPPSLQDIILKILEYVVTVVNCVPEQELLSLCWLLQQKNMPELKQTILSFFVKLISFDQQYKKVLREIGLLDVLLDDLKQQKFLSSSEEHNEILGDHERQSSSSSFQKHLDNKDTIISSPKLLASGSDRFLLFETEGTINVAWDCMVSLLKKAEVNQSPFRSANGVKVLLPLLASDIHRSGVLRILSILIIEDVTQAHPEELGALVEILQSGMVSTVSGFQYKLQGDAKCDILGALWRILGVNSVAQRVFGEATGFSLLLTMIHNFQSDGPPDRQPLLTHMKVLTYLVRVVTAGVCGSSVNRTRLHTVISSQAFSDLLTESGLLCVDYEKQVIQLLLELALEIVFPPSSSLIPESAPSSDMTEVGCANFLLSAEMGSLNPSTERIYNAGAVQVLIRCLLLFTPKVQLDILNFIEKLAHESPFNKENLTSIGCLRLLLETIHPFIMSSSSLLTNALQIVEVLGAYRLSSSEFRIVAKYILQTRLTSSGSSVVSMMESLIHMEDATTNISLAPYVEMDMNKFGHASFQVSLGDRSWPPAAGYSFVCWFQFQNLLKIQGKEPEQPSKLSVSKRRSNSRKQVQGNVLRLFSVGSPDDGNRLYAELYLQDDGVLTLATGNSCSLSFSGLELDEEKWHHLAIVHSKPNALAGLFQASVAYIYLDGKLRHTGKLGYSPSPLGNSLQVTVGTPTSCARVSELSWKLRCCHLFEEVLTSGSICFMYILGRGYRGTFQDTDLMQFVPSQACGGDSMAILDSLDAELPLASNMQRADTGSRQGNLKSDGSGIVWDLERLQNLSGQLSGKKLIFAFDGISSEAYRAPGTSSMFNLVDPTSGAASPIGGIPRLGRLHGDSYICRQCVIGDSLRTVGGITVVLALVEAAETRNMLHMALALLSCALHQNPQNVRDMQAYRGYHLLSLFLHRRMPLVDMQSLEMFFQIAACEAAVSEPLKTSETPVSPFPTGDTHESSYEYLTVPKFDDEVSSDESHGDMDVFSVAQDSLSHISEFESSDIPTETSSCIVLSNADMVEHVLLDWTLWVTSPVSLQISLLGFLERLVSLRWYKNHNLTVLRRINLLQHLLVTLQRGDVEVPVLEKLVELLGIILENSFLGSELEQVVKFVIMTFDPPKVTQRHQICRESMGKHVIVRNMLLEMLIDLQMSIDSGDLVEQWHKLVSSKLITYFLDESVHPTSMRWIMTLLGVCLSSSPTFSVKFRSGRGYQGLARVLPSFYDSPEIYYTLFCLIFGKPVYPRLPEVRLLDFHAIMPSNGNSEELKFVELLESVTAMFKSTFDRLNLQLMVAYQAGNLSQISTGLLAELVDESEDMIGELQGDALMHKTYAARLMGGEVAAPAAAMSVLRFMVDLAKICHPFSTICRRFEFLESCIDLYFSCIRAACAVKLAKSLSVSTDGRNLNDSDDNHSLQHTFSSLSHEQEQSKSSTSVGSFPQGQISTNSEDTCAPPTYPVNDVADDVTISSRKEPNKSLGGVDAVVVQNSDGDSLDSTSRVTSGGKVRKASRVNLTLDVNAAKEYSNSSSWMVPNSPAMSEKSISKGKLTPSASPVFALTSWLGGSSHSEAKSKSVTTPSFGSSVSVSEVDTLQDSKSGSQQWSAASAFFALNPKLLLEIEESGYGGGPCSGSATAVLDFVAEVLADMVTEQLKAAQIIESILETIPLYVDVDCALVFQGLCLSRLMNFLERRLLRDDEEEEKKLDKTRWSLNLEQLCSMITDRVYMGAFPKPGAVLGVLEFMLSMLQLANKDGRIEEAAPSGKGLLYITRGTKQLEAYVYALLKNTNRMIMYCFLPSFLSTIGEDDLVEVIRPRMEAKKIPYLCSSHDKSGIDICNVLQLLTAHKRLIFCPSNPDVDLNSCLSLNLITLLRDRRHMAQSLSVDIIKHLLVHRRATLEELLVFKPNQGKRLDVLHGGFDKMLTGSLSLFFEWLQNSEQTVNKVLEQCASSAWVQYIAGSAKFPGVRIKGMEDRRRKEMGRKTLETTKLDLRHWEQISERRHALGLVRDAMSTELRVIRQDKYGWVLHAESEWQEHLQQLVHERGIFPTRKPPHTEEPEWQLCPIEGPYRMRKKLERCKLKMDTSQIVLRNQVERSGTDLSTGKLEQGIDASETDSFFHFLSDGAKRKCFDGDEYYESVFMDVDEVKEAETPFTKIGWNDDKASSTDETSLHSALEFGVKSSAVSVPISDSFQARSDSGSLMQSSSGMLDEMKPNETKLDKELNCNGEYLVRPYLEHLEKIRFRYNCERVVGLDKHDGIFLIGELCLYVIENFYIDKSGSICEKQFEDDLSVIDQAMGVQKDVNVSLDVQSKSSSSCGVTVKSCVGGRAWAYNGGAWGKEKLSTDGNLPHLWHMWKLESIHEILKRDYQLRPVAVEIFSMDGCNDLLVFHKKEREDVFRNLVAMNLPRNVLDTTISGLSKQEINDGGRLFKTMAKSFSKRWQNGEISNFQYLMHLNTLAGRGYSDLTQYPVFPWVLADYESETLDLADPSTFRKLEKPMGCQTAEGEEEFKKRYESWDDPDVPKFHYGSHYSSAGIVLFYLLRLPPFSTENQKLQGGQFDHADRLFNSVRETWLSAAGKGNTSDVKELIPEFYYMPEFLENRFNLDLGQKQSGEKVENVVLPPWANGSSREFVRKHREALESEYVSENLHHWIDLIFGYKQRGKAAEKAVNVFYHYTYEGSVDIDAVSDPAMKASILAQINHFGQTPKQLFLKPHVKRRSDKKPPSHPLRYCNNLVSREIRKTSSSIIKIYSYNEKILVTGKNNLLKPRTYNKYVAWGFPDRSLRFITYDQDRLLSTHENLHGGDQIQCAGVTHDGRTLVTGGEDGVVCVWHISEEKLHSLQRLRLKKALCAHTAKITCLCVSQSYMVIVSGSDDCTVILWDLSGLIFVKQLPEFSAPVSAIYVNDLTGEIITASGIQLAIWSINGDCLAAVNTTQLPSDIILSVTSATFSDWLDINWFATGHQSGAIKVWQMEHYSLNAGGRNEFPANESGIRICDQVPEYRLVLQKVLKSHKDPVTSLHITSNLKQLLSGDTEGHLISWTLPDENLRTSFKKG